jgi:tRNA pseudouridine38-40 synthase
MPLLKNQFFKAIIAYKGSHFFGWQYQPDQRTVQGELLLALKKLHPKTIVKVKASSRTDRGVHAREQCVSIFVEKPLQSLKSSFTRILPEDIEVKSFQPGYLDPFSFLSKQYRYFFTKKKNVFKRDYETLLPFSTDLDRFIEAWSLFQGEKSFHNYVTQGTEYKSFIRNCFSITVKKMNNYSCTVILESNGFLKQMIRLMAGTALMYSSKKITKKDIMHSFSTKYQSQLGPVLAPNGLFLWKTKF